MEQLEGMNKRLWEPVDLLIQELVKQWYCTMGFLMVQSSHSIMPCSSQPHGLQHPRPPCPSPIPGLYSNSCSLSQLCHPTISSSVIPFSSWLQSFPVSRSFQMSQFFASGGQSILWLYSFLWKPQLQSLSDQFSIPRPSCPIWDNPSFIFSLQLIHHRGLGCKSRKSRDTWSYKQVWPWSTKWSKARLTEFCQENALVIANTLFQQQKEVTLHMDNTRWSVIKSDWLYSLQLKMDKLYTVSKNKTRSWLWLRSWTSY